MVKNEIVLFESKDGKVALPVSVDFDTVWLSLLQMAELFDKDKSVIFRHVKPKFGSWTGSFLTQETQRFGLSTNPHRSSQ